MTLRFVSVVGCVLAAALSGRGSGLAAGAVGSEEDEKVLQSKRTLPVVGRADVLVVGGTFSGVAAAIEAAEAGKRTILLAEGGFLGGLATAGLMAMERHGIRSLPPEREPRSRLLREVIALVEPEGGLGHRRLEPEYVKWALDTLCQRAGVKAVYHSRPAGVVEDGERVSGAVVLSPSGRGIYLAGTVIDATEESSLLSGDKGVSPYRTSVSSPDVGPQVFLGSFFLDGVTAPRAGTEARPYRPDTGDLAGVLEPGEQLFWFPTPWPGQVRGTLVWVDESQQANGAVELPEVHFRRRLDQLCPALKGTVPGFDQAILSLTALYPYVGLPSAPLTEAGLSLREVLEGGSCPAALVQGVAVEEVWALQGGRVVRLQPRPEATFDLSPEMLWAQGKELIVTGGDLLGLREGSAWVQDLDFAARRGEAAGSLAVAATGHEGTRPAASPRLIVPLTDHSHADSEFEIREWGEYTTPGSASEDGLVEAARALPVAARVDLVVAGGDPAGVAAAVAAARRGVKVALACPQGFLGGLVTAEGVHEFMHQSILGGLYRELMDRLADLDARLPGRFTCDPEALKSVFQQMALSSDVRLFLREWPAGIVLRAGRAAGVVIEGEAGRRVILSRMVIDATRDSGLAVAAGVPFQKGRASDGLTQPMTLMYTIIANGPRLQREEDVKFGYFLPGQRVVVNATRVRGDATQVDLLTHAEIVGRQQMVQQLRSLRWDFDYRILHSGPEVFVRETRHVQGDYVLQAEDLRRGLIPADTVVLCDYPIDIHNPTGGPGGKSERVPRYGIPYRCLLPQGVEDLLVTGRALSASHEAFGSCRIESTGMALGEAAGIAAALCLKLGVSPRSLPFQPLGEELRQVGLGDTVQVSSQARNEVECRQAQVDSPALHSEEGRQGDELFRLRLANERNGPLEVSFDQGTTWDTVGRVLLPAQQALPHHGFTASRWGQPATVVGTGVNALHLKVRNDAEGRCGVILSVYPREALAEKSAAAWDLHASLVTDLPAGRSLFGGRLTPFLGSEVLVETAKQATVPPASQPLPPDYSPTEGDRLVVLVRQPPRGLREVVVQNRFGGTVEVQYADGPREVIAEVVKPVVGVGRFGGAQFAGKGGLRVNHPGVLEISTSPLGQSEGFQMVPLEHAEEADLAYLRAGPAWLVVRATGKEEPLAGRAPLFWGCLRAWSARPEEGPVGLGQVESVEFQEGQGGEWKSLSTTGFSRRVRTIRLQFAIRRQPTDGAGVDGNHRTQQGRGNPRHGSSTAGRRAESDGSPG